MTHCETLPPDVPPTLDGIKPGGWWHEAEDGQKLVCDLCPRGCALGPGKRGFCFVRQNVDDRIVSTTYGRSTGFCIDPIEKKPLNHFYPGTSVLSFGTAGCNLGCKFCQNWSISKSREIESLSEEATPAAVANAARELGCRSVAYTYNDPIVWAEYAIDTAAACRAAGVKNVAVTSGYITPIAREAFYEYMDAANVDLKGFTEGFYHKLTGGHLEPVLDTLRWLIHETDVWVEITNLVIPGANDNFDEVRRLCDFVLEDLRPDVPLHFTAFHPDFRMMDRPGTPPETLRQARSIALDAGLKYVYTGNVSDPDGQSTYCAACDTLLIRRDGYRLGAYEIVEGACRKCGTAIAGHFDTAPGTWGPRRQPVRIADYAPKETASMESDRKSESTSRPGVSQEQQTLLFQTAGRRVMAAVQNERPDDIQDVLGQLAEVPLYGAFVSLKRAGRLRSCCGAVGETMPLGKALEQAAIRAAKEDPRFPPIESDELDQLDMQVWLLWGCEPVEAKGEDRVKSVVIGKHGLLITRKKRRGLLLPGVAVEHGLNARQFLEHVCQKAGLKPNAWLDDRTELFRFEGSSIDGQLASVMPEPVVSDAVESSSERLAAVAGHFYPGDVDSMNRSLDQMLPQQREPADWSGVMIPHAGWVYSGKLAAETLSRVRIPRRVIIVCPKHTRPGAALAVAPHNAWQIPGGRVAADPILAKRLAEGVSDLVLDAAPHAGEHAIEVELPLLARLAPETQVVGITMHGGDYEAIQRQARQMADVVSELDELPLFVISSDMNHFENEAATWQNDRMALDAIRTLDPSGLYQTVTKNRISMCGARPAVLVMETLRCLDRLSRCELVGYATSADVSGDTSRVVGYAGMLFG